jgi:hypothetical protein
MEWCVTRLVNAPYGSLVLLVGSVRLKSIQQTDITAKIPAYIDLPTLAFLAVPSD